MVEKPVIQCRVTHVIMVLENQGRHYAGFPYRFVQDGDMEAYTNHFWCCYYKLAIKKTVPRCPDAWSKCGVLLNGNKLMTTDRKTWAESVAIGRSDIARPYRLKSA